MKGKRTVKTYKRFTVGGVHEKGCIVGEKNSHCEVFDGFLRGGVRLEKVRTQNGGEYPTVLGASVSTFFMMQNKNVANPLYTNIFGFITEGGVVYIYDEVSGGFVVRKNFGCKTKCVSAHEISRDARLTFINIGGCFVYARNGEVQLVTPERALPIACGYKGRLFYIAEPYTIVYNVPYEPTNYAADEKNAGRIVYFSEKGNIVGLVPYDGYVYLLLEYGVVRFYCEGSATEFRLEEVAYSGGKIFGDSAGVVATGKNRLFFLAEDGVYTFDGARFEKTCENLEINPVTRGQVCNHAQANGKYYLTYMDENGQKRGLCVDGNTGVGVYTYPFEGLSEVLGEALACYNGTVYALKANGEGEFHVKNWDFGMRGRKGLDKLRLRGEGEVCLVVRGGGAEKTCSLSLNGGAEMDVRLFAEAFDITIILEKGSAVYELSAELLSVKGGGR